MGISIQTENVYIQNNVYQGEVTSEGKGKGKVTVESLPASVGSLTNVKGKGAISGVTTNVGSAYLRELVDLIESIHKHVNRKDELEKRIAQYDKELLDYTHLAELVDLNASEGYKLYERIQINRRERRLLKDEVEMLNVLIHYLRLDSTIQGNVNGAFVQLKQADDKLRNRKYKARVSKDLQPLFDSRCINNVLQDV